jgi:hypothetical protein
MESVGHRLPHRQHCRESSFSKTIEYISFKI